MSLGRKLSRLQSAGPGSSVPTSLIASAAPQEVEEDGPDLTTKAGRLAWLRSQMGDVIARQQQRDIARNKEKCSVDVSPRVDAAQLSQDLPGEDVDTAHGSLRRVVTKYDAHHQHGAAPIAGALSVRGGHLSLLAKDPALADVDLSRALYLDTETTGLAGGAGTIPFLVGLAWFENEELHVEQLLLPEMGRERSLLMRLAERLDEASCLVTYNGKTFDWPLLKTRFVMNRVEVPEVTRHVDLLHICRRVYGRRLKPVRLVTVESEVLQFERVGDVGGEEIPQRYFDVLRGAPGGLLEPVVEHNVHDVVAMVAMVARLGALCARPADHGHAEDLLGLAYTALAHGDIARSREIAEHCAAHSRPVEVVVEALMLAARLAKRTGDYCGCVELLQRALAEAGGNQTARAEAHLALAKLFEHHLRDTHAALTHAQLARPVESEPAHTRRMARLTRLAEKLRSRGAATPRSPGSRALPAGPPAP